MPSADEPEAVVSAEYQAACEPFVVVGQDVELDISFCDMSVSGTSTLLLFPLVDDLEEVSIDARQCEIDLDNVRVDGARTKAWYRDPYELMNIPAQWELGAAQHHVMKRRMAPLLSPEKRRDVPISQREKLMEHSLGCVPHDGSLRISLRPQHRVEDDENSRRPLRLKPEAREPEEERNGIKISIPFRSRRVRDGLHFVGTESGDSRYPHVYTRHAVEPGTASCIFPCIDDPGQRHLFKVSIKCPRTLGDALEQPLATQTQPTQTSFAALDGSRKRKHGQESPPPPAPAPAPPPQHSLIEEDKLLEMTVICSGNLTGEQADPDDSSKKITSFECQNAAARHVGFAVGPFEHVALWAEFRTEEADERLGANATKVHGYCLPGRADEVLNACAPVVAAADYFALEFGRFPFGSYKLCFVEDMATDTAEATSLSLCSNRLLYPADTIDPEMEATRQLVHSLASQYVGVHMVADRRTDRWLEVAIQWYVTDLFMRTICGANWYKFHIKTLADRLVAADVGRPPLHELGAHLEVGDFEGEFLALKAPLVLFILDQRMSKYPGSIGVSRVVSQLVSAANISNTEAGATSLRADEFRRSCEKKSQYRPEAFWEQWVYGAGCPRMVIKQKFNKKNLNVDIVATQVQGTQQQQRPLDKDDFWREFQEKIHHVYAGEVQRHFTGPFTIRIHEADGTPYEHYLDIRDDDRNGTTWSIPYNTKYKRLKRKGRGGAAVAASGGEAGATATGGGAAPDDDVVYFNMLGDVLLSDGDMDNWGLKDWEGEVQHAMDQESYEWIRFDCNFEWLCDISTDMPGYMYLAQLQQDRDVVAHQDAMLFWARGPRHPVASSIETRTVYDRRYYHGVRAMAVDDLPKQAAPEQNYIGMAHLILAFRHFFCSRVVSSAGADVWQPAPNDFSDKAQYAVQSAMPRAIARVRGDRGRCPRSARAFLLDLLLFNDNSSNDSSDQFYVANLLAALTTSLVGEKENETETEKDGDTLLASLKDDDDDDAELRRFIDKTVEELDRYRRMDEWTCSFHNVWTTTALECKMRLMRARVIAPAPLEFLQYLQDDNMDLVRVKAFECLAELGMMAKPPVLKLMLSMIATDRSPFVRDRLLKAFCRGVAAVAFGDGRVGDATAIPETAAEEDDDGLIVEQGEAVTAARQAKQARRLDIDAALAGLRQEVRGNADLQAGLWKTFQSGVLGLHEKRQVLELCEAMFEPEDAILVTLPYPRVWKAARATTPAPAAENQARAPKRCIVHFTSHFRTTPRNPLPAAVPEEPQPPTEPRPPEPKKIRLQSKPSLNSGPPPNSSNGTPRAPTPTSVSVSASDPVSAAPPPRKPSISVTVPKLPSADSISVRPSPKAPTPTPAPAKAAPAKTVSKPAQTDPSPPATVPPASSPPPPPQPNGAKAAAPEKRPRGAPKKRKSGDVEAAVERPKKMAKTDSGGVPARRRIVCLKFTRWDRLRDDIRRKIGAQPDDDDDDEALAEGTGRIRTPVPTAASTPRIKQKQKPQQPQRSSSASSSRPPSRLSSSRPPRASGSPASVAADSDSHGHGAPVPTPRASSSKPRKPLPSSAPAAQTPTSLPPLAPPPPTSPSPPATPATSHAPPAKDAPAQKITPAPSAKPKTVIKLKLPSLKRDPGQ